MFAAGETETVTVVTVPERDHFGDPVPGSGTETDVEGCIFAPGPSTENLTAANQVDSDAVVFMPPGGPAVAPDAMIRARGRGYQVIGDPKVWINACVEVLLRRVEG